MYVARGLMLKTDILIESHKKQLIQLVQGGFPQRP